MTTDSIPDWERDIIQRAAGRENAAAAVHAATAVLNAFDRGILEFSARYMADTLRMLLVALEPEPAEETDGD
jgi:hypothetical protein